MSKKITKIVVHYNDGTTESISAQESFNTNPWLQQPVINSSDVRCPQCSIELSKMDNYNCPRLGCVMGL